jgi:hypothetical protein
MRVGADLDEARETFARYELTHQFLVTLEHPFEREESPPEFVTFGVDQLVDKSVNTNR